MTVAGVRKFRYGFFASLRPDAVDANDVLADVDEEWQSSGV